MQTIKQLLDIKGRDVWSVPPSDLVYDAIKIMVEKGIGALAVLEGDKFVGIVTERDYINKMVLQQTTAMDVPVHQIMTTDVIYTRLDQTVEECMALMTNKRVRHLPVIEEEKLIGLISIGDLVKALISDQQFQIDQLANYVTGNSY